MGLRPCPFGMILSALEENIVMVDLDTRPDVDVATTRRVDDLTICPALFYIEFIHAIPE